MGSLGSFTAAPVMAAPMVQPVHTVQRHVDVHVPHVQTRHVPRVETQTIDRHVPRVEIQTVEKLVEVPQVQMELVTWISSKNKKDLGFFRARGGA